MPSHIDDFKDADGTPVQPYFAAYMVEHGKSRVNDVSTLDYCRWISARWDDFRDSSNYASLQEAYRDRAGFMAFLAERVGVAA